jgi:hypothetical protein
MDSGGRLALGDLNQDTIRKICIDFIVNEIPPKDIQLKYNITEGCFYHIRDRMKLVAKREKYRRVSLDKALNKLSTQRSKTIVKAMDLMLSHIEGVSRMQSISDTKVLPKDVTDGIIKIFDMLNKDKRLDDDKPTDNVGIRVKVEMPSIPVIGEQMVQSEVVQPPIEGQQQKKTIETDVKVDDSVVGVLD